MLCEWEDAEPAQDFVCIHCGWKYPRCKIRVLPYNRKCAVQRPRGLGDVLSKLFRWFGIKKKAGCGCGKRQEKLNRWFPFH